MTTETEDIQAIRAERDELKAQLAQCEQQLTRAEEDLRRAIAESYALYLTSLDITSQLDLKSTLSSILRRAMLLINADGGLVGLLDHTTGDLIVSAELNISPSIIGTRLRSGEDVAGEVLLTGRSLVIENYQEWANRLPQFTGFPIYATAALPLRWQGKVIGVLSLHRNKPNLTFSLDDLDSLQHVTVQAAIAIHNAQLYAEEKARNHQLATLYQASTRITGSLDREAVLRTAAESLITALDVPACTIYEYRGESRGHPELNVLADYALSRVGRLEPVERSGQGLSPHIVRHVLQAGLWVVLQRNDPLLLPELSMYMDQRDVKSMLLVPIALGQRVIGLIELCQLGEWRRFAAADIDTAQALAAHIGVAIRHAQLHYQLQAQRVNEQAVLLKLARRLLETTERQQVAREVVQAVAEAFDAQYVNLLLTEGDYLKSYASLGWDQETMEALTWSNHHDSSIGYAATTGQLVILDDTLTETRFKIRPIVHENGLRSAIVAPITYGDQMIGILDVFRPEPHSFTADDAQLLFLLAYQTAVALERARLFESVQAYAEVLEFRIDDRIREIRAEKERTEAILQATGEALIVFDQAGYIQRVNRAFESQYGRSAEEVIGLHCTDIFGFDLHNKAPFPDPTSASERVWRGELQAPRCDGSTYDAAVTLSRVLDSTSKTLAIVASLRDISYLKELDRMKDRFVSNVSHELRTPLANMKLYTHLLVNGFEDRREQYLATLQRETARLQQLIEDLLLLSRLELGSVAPTMRPLDVNYLVGTLVEDRRVLAKSYHLELNCSLYPEPLVTLADEKMLNQAVTNLLANAMNYTLPGGQINVSTALVTENSRAIVEIAVADTGIGITPEDQGRLFERFFRGAAALSTGAAGTGLGMSIVREVMERHDGQVVFESEPGQGSTFHLRFPLRPPDPAQDV